MFHTENSKHITPLSTRGTTRVIPRVDFVFERVNPCCPFWLLRGGSGYVAWQHLGFYEPGGQINLIGCKRGRTVVRQLSQVAVAHKQSQQELLSNILVLKDNWINMEVWQDFKVHKLLAKCGDVEEEIRRPRGTVLPMCT